MTPTPRSTSRRRLVLPTAAALSLSLVLLAAPAAAQDTTKAAQDSAAAAAAAKAAATEACNQLKSYAKKAATDSVAARWTSGTLFSATDSTSKQMKPQMPRIGTDSASLPDSLRTVAVTAGTSCRAAPTSQVMQQLVQTQLGKPRPVIGVQFQAVTPKDTAGLGLTDARGLLVMGTTAGFGAAAAGLAAGDVILGVNGENLSINQFMQRASQWKDGQVIKVDVVHKKDGKRETLDIPAKLSK